MSIRNRIGPLLALILMIASTAACEPPEETGIVQPRPSASASAPLGQGGLGGSVDGNSNTEPVVQYVQLQPTSLDLNVPAAEGIPSAELASTASLTARAILTSGEPDSSGVEWIVMDPQRLAVDAAGHLSVKPGAPSGITAVTAVSKRNPALKAQAAVTVTRDGMLAISGLPEDGSYVRVTVIRNGAFMKTHDLGEDARVRLPEGTAYDVQIHRISYDSSQLLGDHSGLAILPNGVTIATASP